MRRVAAVALSLSLLCSVVAGCSRAEETRATGETPPNATVLADDDRSGVEVSRALFRQSSVLVVAAPDDFSQAHAASLAVGLRAPMLTATPDTARAVADEARRLDAGHVLTVGDVSLPDLGDTSQPAPITGDDVKKGIDVDFAPELEVPADQVDDVTVHQDLSHPQLLRAGTAPADPGAYDGPKLAPQNEIRGDDGFRVLVTDATSVAAIATARASGAGVSHLRAADPRVDGGSVDDVRTAETVVALGPGWGPDFARRLQQATTMPQLPGGGQVIFPGRRMVALYGSPHSEALGALGEQSPEESVERVRRLVADYQPFSPEPVVPAFEIIGTVASSSPGADGNFTNEWPPEDFEPMVDAITAAGGYAVIDLQPGRARFIDQVKPFAELLKRPGVGLALDPEWKLTADQKPLGQVGSADAAEINEVGDWLAELTRESGGPQKLFVLHQFQAQMLADRDRINTSHDELATVIHVDGHGTPDLKFGTWNLLLQNLPPGIFMAWKNFYDEDTPTFTPEETMAVSPRPWFVSYQ